MNASVLVAVLGLFVLALAVAGGVALGFALASRRARRSMDDQQVYESSDSTLQSIVVAKMALDLGDVDRAKKALDAAAGEASDVATGTIPDGEMRRSRSGPRSGA